MSFMSCTYFQHDLKAYADGELSPLRRAFVRRHLTHCASCREEIMIMAQMTEDLRASEPEESLPAGLRDKIIGVPLAPTTVQTGRGTGQDTKRPPSASGSPSIGGRGASSRKRPVLAWGLAGAALVAWFVCFPLFQHVREDARLTETASSPLAYEMRNVKVFKPVPKMPPAPASAAVPQHFTPLAMPVPPMNRAVTTAGAAPRSVAGDPLSATPDTDLDLSRQVHKEASIGVQVANPEATGDKINAMVQETGGYVAANNLTTGDDGLKTGELIVKVPVTQFETFLGQVAKLGTVESKNISGQDITEQTSDAHEAQSVQESDLTQSEARLKALGAKAKWEDQENTRDLRIHLAQTRARLKLLTRMAALGTITIDLGQTPKSVTAPAVTNGFTGTLKATTHDALQSLVGSAAALVALVIWLLAYAPIWVPLAFLGRYALKEYRKREAT